jgi:hypothetical protein
MRAEALPANPASALPRSAPYTWMSATQQVIAVAQVVAEAEAGKHLLAQCSCPMIHEVITTRT